MIQETRNIKFKPKYLPMSMFVYRYRKLNSHQDGHEQSPRQRETAARGEQGAVCPEPALQDHIRGNVSTYSFGIIPTQTLLTFISPSRYDIFGKYGAIRQIRVGNTPETRGTAFVVYEDIFDAKNACDHLSGFNVCNRSVTTP